MTTRTNSARFHYKQATKFGIKAVFNLALTGTLAFAAYTTYTESGAAVSGIMALFALILVGYGIGALEDTRQHIRFARNKSD